MTMLKVALAGMLGAVAVGMMATTVRYYSRSESVRPPAVVVRTDANLGLNPSFAAESDEASAGAEELAAKDAQSVVQAPATLTLDRAVAIVGGRDPKVSPEAVSAAISVLNEAVKQDNPKALQALGDMLRAGKVVTADPASSIVFYERAAKAGQSDAAVTLGFMFARGEGIARDVGRAIAFLEQGVGSKEDLGALKLLGDLYSDSALSFFDLGKAGAYYERAVAQKNASAALALGGLALRGDSGEKDFATAARHYSKALALGSDKAPRMLGDLYYAADNPARDVAKAAEYYHTAALDGDQRAILALAAIYARKEVPADGIGEVITLLSTVVDGPHEQDALKRLGDLYSLEGPAQDIRRAKENYARSGEMGNGWALLALGDLLRAGVGSDPDVNAAAKSYQQAAEAGVARAYVRLGDLAWKEEGAKPNPISINYYTLAEQAGDPLGGLRLARVEQSYYDNGDRIRAAAERYTTAVKLLGPQQAIQSLQSGDPRGLVGIVQYLLSADGYDVGAVDGVYGARTGAALIRYCADRGLPDCSGEIETAPLEALLASRSSGIDDAETLRGLTAQDAE